MPNRISLKIFEQRNYSKFYFSLRSLIIHKSINLLLLWARKQSILMRIKINYFY